MTPTTLAEETGARLKERGLTLSLAESCTGGLLSKLITDIPGSSEYYAGGVITYSNDLKQRLLGVKASTLETFGAVSPETATEMADGTLRNLATDIAIAITGIAGPTGGTTEKPVGLVFIALASKDRETIVNEFRFSGTRSEIREEAATAALDMLLTFF